MVSITRVGIARSRRAPDGRCILGPDEDLFTLAAAAVEASAAEGELPSVQAVHLVDLLPPVADWAIPALVGYTAPASRYPSMAEAVSAGLEAATRGRVLVVEVGQTSPVDGPVALALLLEEGAGWEVTTSAVGTSTSLPSTYEVLERLERDPEAATAEIGSPPGPVIRIRRTHPIAWGVDGPVASTTDSFATEVQQAELWPEPSLDRVSEGAYIPYARYRESIPARWRFLAERCSACGSLSFPPRGQCSKCHRHDTLTTEALPREGEVVARTAIGKGGQPTEFDPWVERVGTYSVAIIELAPGCRATVQLADFEKGEGRIGERVATRLRRLYPMEGEWRYGRKAVPRARAGKPEPVGSGESR